MSLTPVFQDEPLCADCPLWAFCGEGLTTLSLLMLFDELAFARSYVTTLRIIMEIDALYALAEREKYRAEIGSPEMAWKTLETERATAIDDETKLTWEQYEDARLPLRAKGATLPIINAPKTQGARLADMAWLHTPRNRRPYTKRPVRKGRRYMATTPDHGTAPARRQIEANRREQLRKARRNRRNPHYTPYWKLRAQREEQTTWGEARGELIVLDGWGITEGLHYLSTKMCTDPECCPS